MAGPKNLVKPGFGAERMALFTRRESAIGPYLTTAPVQDLQPVTENCWGRVRVSCGRACDASRHALLAIGIRAP